MKRLVPFLVVALVVFSALSAHAQQKCPLGNGNFALKVDYFKFTGESIQGLDLEDGAYIGLEGYASLFMPNLYLGVESGWASTENSGRAFVFGRPQNAPGVPVPVELDTDYVPIEFNGKYVFEITPSLVFDAGAGISLNYFNVELKSLGRELSKDDWLFGGQFFGDLTYKIQNWFIGANIKYQLTEDLEIRPANSFRVSEDISADNLRVGGQVGLMF